MMKFFKYHAGWTLAFIVGAIDTLYGVAVGGRGAVFAGVMLLILATVLVIIRYTERKR